MNEPTILLVNDVDNLTDYQQEVLELELMLNDVIIRDDKEQITFLMLG